MITVRFYDIKNSKKTITEKRFTAKEAAEAWAKREFNSYVDTIDDMCPLSLDYEMIGEPEPEKEDFLTNYLNDFVSKYQNSLGYEDAIEKAFRDGMTFALTQRNFK